MKFFTAALVSIAVALPLENARDGAAQGAAAGATIAAAASLPGLALLSAMPGVPAAQKVALLKGVVPEIGVGVLSAAGIGAAGGAAAGSVAARRHHNDVSNESA